jgi:hypothetical protein
MNITILIVIILTFIITVIGTLAYAVRIVGVSTGKIAVSFALFNVLVLVSRAANSVQSPLLTKFVETNGGSSIINSFYLIIAFSGIATIVGAFSIPTFQRVLSKGVLQFSEDRSVPKLLLHGFTKSGIRHIKKSVKVPDKANITKVDLSSLPIKIVLANVIIVAIQTVGFLAPIYAGVIAPELRATCITLTSVINWAATLLLYLYVYPFLSIKTDDVIDGKCSEAEFRQCVVGMVGSKVIGTFSAIFLLVPASNIIVIVARLIP